MKRKHYLLDLFNGVEDRFIVEAAESRESAHVGVRKNRMVLIAAAVALALLLMGCVAVFLGLQQRKIGEIPVTQNFDAYGNTLPQSEKTWYIATMSGYDNSPAQRASQEWNEFQRTYQPAGMTNEVDLPDIPNNYEFSYCCFDQTMVAKLDEIVEKYDLELLGVCAVAQAWQRDAAFEALGIAHLVLADAPAEVRYGACRVYPPYNFVCDVDLTLTGEDAPWTEEVYCEVYYLQAGYMAAEDAFLYDPETTQEWEYTAADGTKLLLALSGKDGIVLAQRKDSTIVIRMDLAWKQGVFLDVGTALPTQEALERLADCFDYKVTTQASPMEGLQEKFDGIPDPNAVSPEDYDAPRYAGFAAYLKEYYLWPELVEYALYDINGDGEQELLIRTGDGYCIGLMTNRDGKITEHGGGWLYAGGIVEQRDPMLEIYSYWQLLGRSPEEDLPMEHLHSVSHLHGEWKIDGESCTAQEAADLMGQYKPLELTWRPMTAFPMDEAGTTFGEVLAQEGNPTGPALLKFYGEHYSQDSQAGKLAWFTLRDINDDGIDDLLLSSDGEFVDAAYTCKRGKFVGLGSDFYLCKENVMHSVDEVDRYNEGVLERHRFTKLTGQDALFCYQLTHNRSTGVWTDTSYAQISAEAGQAILEKYAHVELGMRPIRELAGG